MFKVFIYCNIVLMSAESDLTPEKKGHKMTDRHFSHPLTAALVMLIGTAGTEFHSHTHTQTHTHTHTCMQHVIKIKKK